MKKISTPWGISVLSTAISPDEKIVRVHTESHGGYGVSRQLTMPAHLDLPEDGQSDWRWYEEDEAWCCVPLAFPQYFDEKMVAAAAETAKDSFPHIYEAHFNCKLTPQESAALYRAKIDSDLRCNFRVATAYGDWAWDVPRGYTFVVGRRASDGEVKGFLVPKSEYDCANLSEMVLDAYPTFEPNRTLPYVKPKPEMLAA